MLLKTVSIYRYGKKLKQFRCEVCDLSRQVLNFHGVIGLDGHNYKDYEVKFVGDSYIEVDRAGRQCICRTNYPEIEIIVTW